MLPAQTGVRAQSNCNPSCLIECLVVRPSVLSLTGWKFRRGSWVWPPVPKSSPRPASRHPAGPQILSMLIMAKEPVDRHDASRWPFASLLLSSSPFALSRPFSPLYPSPGSWLEFSIRSLSKHIVDFLKVCHSFCSSSLHSFYEGLGDSNFRCGPVDPFAISTYLGTFYLPFTS